MQRSGIRDPFPTPRNRGVAHGASQRPVPPLRDHPQQDLEYPQQRPLHLPSQPALRRFRRERRAQVFHPVAETLGGEGMNGAHAIIYNIKCLEWSRNNFRTHENVIKRRAARWLITHSAPTANITSPDAPGKQATRAIEIRHSPGLKCPALREDGMLDHLKANNRAWAQRKLAADAGFFKRLEGQQAPEYLWIGCSDSRVPANEIVDLDPGELFVHRNVANLAPPQDANYLSVLQFAVDVLKVKHIMVVGHYGCGGIAAAIDGRRRGLVDHWLHPIREVYAEHRRKLEEIPAGHARLDRLCELNIMRQVRNVATELFVQDAWARGQPLWVHGWVYSISNGLITDLNVTVGPDAR
jgi:carbonic anhydrase